MNKQEIQIFSIVSIVLCALTWGIFNFFYSFEIFSLDSLRYLNVGITISCFIWVSYFKWMWKWSYLRKIMYRPNMNGTWLGNFHSNWKDEHGNYSQHTKFVLVVYQTWFSFSIKAFTKKQRTESYAEAFKFEESKGIKLLVYLYSDRRGSPGEHDARQGVAQLDLLEDEKLVQLEGDFWTHAGTRGQIRVQQICKDTKVDSYNQAKGKWNNDKDWVSLSNV